MSISMHWPSQSDREAARTEFQSALVRYWHQLHGSEHLGALVEEGAQPDQSNDVEHPNDHGGNGVSVLSKREDTIEKLAIDATDDAPALWKETVQGGAPAFVRGNVWLMAAWAKWCVKAEEPRLYWLALGVAGFLSIGWVYQLVRFGFEALTKA